MIKIFNATDTDFKTAGNIIINPLHCHEIKKKSLNGWYIEVEIPIKYKEYIEADKLCVVKTKSKLKPQAFRINDSITYTNRKIKFTAEHVMFDSRRYVLLDARPTNLNGQNGLKYVNERTDKISPFSITSNVENVSTAYFIRKTLLESWQVFEERWGGVFEADNWDISFKQSIGKDNGETIVYGKNMQGFEIFEDWSNVCTKILPVGYDGLLLPEKYLESETQYEISYTKIVDFQTDLEAEEQTETNLLVELRNNANKYLEENCVPKVSYTVNSNVNNDLEIGDTIKVLHPFVNIFTEVLEYEYDLISEKVKSLTFGNYTRDVKTKFNNIKNTIETIKQTVSKQEITIKEQTNLINSLNKNGYVYIDDNEILILDQLPKEKAKNVWRFGLGGIGFSSKGYEGPFETAITMDGKINADFITTGTMAVDRIESLANFITNTSASIAAIELQQDSITTKVSSVEQSVENITNTQNTATGKNIHLEDSSDDPLVSIKVKGSTTQATRSGKNLLDIKNENMQTSYCTKEYNGNSLTLTSTETAMPARTTIPVDYPLNKALTISFDATFLKGYDLNNNSVVYFRSNSTNIGSITLTKDNQKHSYSITIPNGIAEEGYTFWLYIKPSPIEGVVSIKFDNIQIEQGTTATEYEQYGASPSPDYPSEIENIEGKNLFDGNKSEWGKYNVWQHNTGNYANAFVNVINIKGLNKCSISFKNNTRTFRFGYQFIDDNENYLSGVYWSASTNEKVFANISVPENASKIIISQLDGQKEDDIEIQLEEGTVATSYVPYNSLEFKVEGKNRFDINKRLQGTINSDGDLEISRNVNKFYEYDFKENTQYTFSAYVKNGNENKGNVRFKIVYKDGTENGEVLLNRTTIYEYITYTSALNKTIDYISINYGSEGKMYIKNGELQIEEGTQATPYEPYKSQVATFPLGEEKLMEGSYLADDGLHHSRKQVVLDGSDDEGWSEYTASGEYSGGLHCYTGLYNMLRDSKKALSSSICSHFKNPGTWVIVPSVAKYGTYQDNPNTFSRYFITDIPTLSEWKNWLAEQYANGTPLILEYELAEPETVPYTEAQQEDWDKIEQLHTYKNVTNIFSDTELDIVYVRDNGLSDMYETKQNASKNYTKTVEKFAEQKITTDNIQQNVSKTETIVANNYKELKTKFDDYAPKSDVITLQNSVERIQTDTYTKTEINTKLTDGSVTKVTTTCGTFDENGLTIEKTNAKTKGNFNEKGMKVVDATGSSEEILLFAGYDEETDETIVKSKNMTVEKYLTIGANCRFEDYVNPVLGGKGTGAFTL